MAGDAGLVDEVVNAARSASPEVAGCQRPNIAVMVAAALAVAEHAVGQSGEPGDDVYATAESLGADRAAQGMQAGVTPDAMLDALVRFNRYGTSDRTRRTRHDRHGKGEAQVGPDSGTASPTTVRVR